MRRTLRMSSSGFASSTRRSAELAPRVDARGVGRDGCHRPRPDPSDAGAFDDDHRVHDGRTACAYHRSARHRRDLLGGGRNSGARSQTRDEPCAERIHRFAPVSRPAARPLRVAGVWSGPDLRRRQQPLGRAAGDGLILVVVSFRELMGRSSGADIRLPRNEPQYRILVWDGP